MKQLLATLLALVAVTGLSKAQDAMDVKAEIDHSIRWLRAQQDEATGHYGDGIPTAWVLLAFAESPRHYKRTDGPFVARALDWLVAQQREDGSIRMAGTSPEAALEQTAFAAYVLTRYADDSLKEPLTRALAFVSRAERSPAPFPPELTRIYTEPERSELVRDARARLAKRPADAAYWTNDADEPSVVRTAREVCALSRMRAALSAWNRGEAPKHATALPAFQTANAAKIDAALERGAEYLLGVAEDGCFGAPGQPDAGLTAMAVGALLCVHEPRPDGVQAAIDQGLAWLVSLQREDGSIHDGKLANYITSASILALARADDAKLEPVITRARGFLVQLQADEGEHFSPDHPYYGGIGYGGDERPDLSNLQMSIEALVAAGLDKDNPAFQRAVAFLQRCQNRSESNDVAIVDGDATFVSGNDGGAAYAPGNSPAGTIELPGGKQVARSYGSMTYALLKGYILAGIDKDDPRVQAAWKWLCENYTLDVNPGFEASGDPTAAYQGLYYYFLTMAKALDLFGADVVTDAAGTEHPWRAQLSGRLIAMQRKTDGSWVNKNSPRWWEGNPVLATSYAMLALDAAR